jgi:transcriptional regulator with XRE-family HTH domain
MDSRDEFVKMIKEEAEAWKPADDKHLDALEEALAEFMISSGVVRAETLVALEREVTERQSEEEPDVDRVLGRAFGVMMKRSREARAESSEEVASETGSDALTLERIEEGRVNPSVLSPTVLASWFQHLSLPLTGMKAALLLALEYVSRTSTQPTASFARSSDVNRRGRALTRTEANEYLDRVSVILDRRGQAT